MVLSVVGKPVAVKTVLGVSEERTHTVSRDTGEGERQP